ncbi:MAG: DUF4136 domain-containing protein, partial [Hymenobacteraceae bacterium]|nr:DUF4136 domain-containing protein [Hymenobacteraceae bacterium]
MRQKLKGILNFAVVFSLVTLAGCTRSVNVTTDYDRTANFSKYQTYSFFQENPTANQDVSTAKLDPSLDLYIKSAIRQNMQRRGLRYTQTNPDVKVAYDVAVSTEYSVNTTNVYPAGFGYGYSYWYGYRYNYGFNRFPVSYRTINQYKEGTVVIDIV